MPTTNFLAHAGRTGHYAAAPTSATLVVQVVNVAGAVVVARRAGVLWCRRASALVLWCG
jgi:hypothetical protein